ncbi:MAG: hypothetical protein DRK00_10605, partial [Thermoprotei archaeon]
DICYCHENPGAVVVRSYDLPKVRIEDGGIRGDVAWLFPSCGEYDPQEMRVALPIIVDEPIDAYGPTVLRLYAVKVGPLILVNVERP